MYAGLVCQPPYQNGNKRRWNCLIVTPLFFRREPDAIAWLSLQGKQTAISLIHKGKSHWELGSCWVDNFVVAGHSECECSRKITKQEDAWLQNSRKSRCSPKRPEHQRMPGVLASTNLRKMCVSLFTSKVSTHKQLADMFTLKPQSRFTLRIELQHKQ
jgi:hypothetical protein